MTEVAKEFGCYVGFNVSTTTAYEMKLGKKKVQEEFQRQLKAFDGFECDILIAEVKEILDFTVNEKDEDQSISAISVSVLKIYVSEKINVLIFVLRTLIHCVQTTKFL